MSSLWDYDENDLLEETVGGNWISNNGCYDLKIESAEIVNSKESKAQAIALTLANDDERARVTLWHRSKTGDSVTFVKRILNQICYLAKTNVNNLKVDTIIYDGDKRKTVIPTLVDVNIGAFIKVKINDQGNYDYTLEGVYEPKSKKTIKELQEKSQDSYIYKKMFQKYYGNTEETKRVEEKKEPSFIDDEFPF